MKRSIAAVAGLVLVLAAPAAWSQAWPTKPIKILVGVTPGGTTDMLMAAASLGIPIIHLDAKAENPTVV